jgi:hypothetical protein
MARIQVGDVFVVPVGDGRSGVGQIVGRYGRDAYYFAVFDRLVAEDDGVESALSAVSSPLRFLALSLDAKLHVGHWSVVGRAPIPDPLPFPAYKEAVGSPVAYDVVDYTGEMRRPATESEVARLPNRKVVAPVRLEKALRASLGLEPWLEAFDGLRIGADDLTTAALFR